MTTDTIANLANLDGVGSGLDVQSILRNIVMPEFLMDLGEARWRNVATTLSLPAGDRQVDLPDDFWAMKSIVIPPSGATSLGSGQGGLKYIGEDTDALLAAEFNTTAAKPTAYWIAARAGTGGDPGVGSFRAVRFNCPSDGTYTIPYVYERGPVFEDEQSLVDMDTWVPSILQPGIVMNLRMQILKDRFGQNDPRFGIAKAEYDAWIDRALTRGTDQAKRNFAKFAS